MARPQAPVGAPNGRSVDEEHRRRLVSLRDRLESAIEGAGDRELAPLAARYVDVLEKLAGLPEVKEGDVLDEFTARRARGAKPSGAKRSAEGGA